MKKKYFGIIVLAVVLVFSSCKPKNDLPTMEKAEPSKKSLNRDGSDNDYEKIKESLKGVEEKKGEIK